MSILHKMSRDLSAEFPDIKGFSKRNLEQMRQWYLFLANSDEIAQQLVAQLPWGHNLTIIAKVKDALSAAFYVRKTIENNWSRAVLIHHILSTTDRTTF